MHLPRQRDYDKCLKHECPNCGAQPGLPCRFPHAITYKLVCLERWGRVKTRSASKGNRGKEDPYLDTTPHVPKGKSGWAGR